MMIDFRSAPTLAAATVVWLVWRVMLWRHRGVEPVRELAVAALFAWTMVIVHFTFFPLQIIFYDWNGRSSLVPFASTLQLLRETPPQVAFRNIVGNLLLFLPLGAMLVVLYPRLRTAAQLAWRVAAISVLIELTQLASRARAIDVDDVLLNTAGAMLGWALARAALALLERHAGSRALLERAGAAPVGEPLRHALVPALCTVALVVPTMMVMIASETLGEGIDGIDGVALDSWQDGAVVARADVEEHTYLLGTDQRPDGQLARLASFERVPGRRYTPQILGEPMSTERSTLRWSITAFNPSAGEQPALFVYGVNRDGASTLRVRGNGLDETLTLPSSPYFLFGFGFVPVDEDDGRLQEFELTVTDAAGEDVTDRFLTE